MTKEAQRIAIAEALGWKHRLATQESPVLKSGFRLPNYYGDPIEAWWHDDFPGVYRCPPNYLSDLNAIHEAVQLYRRDKGNQFFFREYQENLFKVACSGFREDSLYRYSLCQFDVTEATAAQRAEAFLRTLNLWTDDACQRRSRSNL